MAGGRYLAGIEKRKEKIMKECIINGCNSVELVYSGVDAFLLGVDVETICYEHANKAALEGEGAR